MAMVRNPYERRHIDNSDDAINVGMPMLAARGVRPVFEMEDLEAVVRSAFQRGREHEDEIAIEHERLECLVAWDNGYANGAVAGRTSVLDLIGEQFSSEFEARRLEIVVTLEALDAGNKKVTREEMAKVLRAALRTIGAFEQSRTNGFGPLPW
jgi:hypothetical protein